MPSDETLYKLRNFEKVEEKYTHIIEERLSPSILNTNEIKDCTNWNENIAIAFNNRGHARYMQVEFKKAIEDYTIAIQYNPSMAEAFYNRGTILYRLSQFDEAIEDFKQCIQLKSDFEDAIIALDKSLTAKDKIEKNMIIAVEKIE